MAKIPCEHDQSSDIANYIGGGVRYKYFNKTVNQAFVANTEYTFSLSDFGFNGINPKGFAIQMIGGNSNLDYEGMLFYNSVSKKVTYKCKAANTTSCTFQGIVFY